jgi:hypothetical protein
MVYALLTVAAGGVPASSASARLIENWPYDRLFKESDLVVIASVASVEDCKDRRSDNPWKIEFLGVNTTFKVESVLKGKAADTIKVLHYKLEEGVDIRSGPLLVSFRKEGQAFQTKRGKFGLGRPDYMLFLKVRKDGRYEPVSGPIDPGLAVREMHKPLPDFETREAKKRGGDGKEPVTGEAKPACAPPKDKDAKPANDKIKEVAGTAEFLRGVPKRFATLKAVDTKKRRVTLLIEGESLAKEWSLVPDAEIKLAGWWGRLEQFTVGDRVWVWFKTDRKRQPVAVAMLADEITEQDIHGDGVTLQAVAKDSITLKPTKGADRAVKLGKAEVQRGTEKVGLDAFKTGDHVYVQSASGNARVMLDVAAFESRQAAQKAWLRKRWTDEGLPGAVAFAHTFSGELDFMLDHEAMRWGRSLKYGDKVTLSADPPITAIVKSVKPWRERTQLRLVVNSFDQADLTPGQRLHLKMTPPPAEVDTAKYPPDIDQPRSKEERVEWFLASIYCTCSVSGDGCTGDFYTLASCNPNACGMPNHMRKIIRGKIEKGLTDKQIFEELLKEKGSELVKPHLRP